MIKTILALIFSCLLGYSLTHIPWIYIPVIWEVWAVVAVLSLIGILICLYLSRERKIEPSPKEPKVDEALRKKLNQLEKEFSQVEKEFKQAIRGHLKVSIIFWSYFYKKEKVKTFEEAKKEVIQDLKKEFLNLPWMETIVEGIRQELTKYK